MMTLLAFIVTIGLLVTIHEYGHYQVARWCGIRVLRFSIGFGKPLWKTTLGQDRTEFVLAAIPLGGYVKMLDERELQQEREAGDATNVEYSEAELSRAFNRKSVYQRIAVVLAGPMANLLLAIVLYWALFMTGVTGLKPIIGEVAHQSLASKANLKKGDELYKIDNQPVKTWQEARWLLLDKSLEQSSVQIEIKQVNHETHIQTLQFSGISNDAEIDVLEKLGLSVMQPAIPAIIGEILPSSAAEKAGFFAGDQVLSIDQVKIADWEQVVGYVKASPNKLLVFEVARQQQVLKLKAIPEAIEEQGKTVGRLGASVQVDRLALEQLLIEIQYTPLEAMQKAVAKTWETSVFSLKMLANMVTGKVSWKGISGPVSIANFAGESANMGLKVFLGFLALVSISIGVLNLLPIPMLDGGHLMYYIVEIFKGTPVSEQVMLTGQKIGLGVLGLLMMVALFNDVNRFVIG